MNFLSQLAQNSRDYQRVRAMHPRPQPGTIDKPNGSDHMPILEHDYNDAQGKPLRDADGSAVIAPLITDRVQHGQPVTNSMLGGLRPDEIVEAYKMGAFLRDPSEAPRVDFVKPYLDTENYQGGPNGDPRNANALPGTSHHPVEMKYGPTDDFVQDHGYIPQIFSVKQPDGSHRHMTYGEAAALMAGQLTARRMRMMGAGDPSLQVPHSPSGAMLVDPLLLDVYGSDKL